MNESEKRLLRAANVVLDMEPVFHHEIKLLDEHGFLIEKIKLKPDESQDTFFEIVRLWNRLKKESKNEDVSTSRTSS